MRRDTIAKRGGHREAGMERVGWQQVGRKKRRKIRNKATPRGESSNPAGKELTST
jgi:hypothetical protein